MLHRSWWGATLAVGLLAQAAGPAGHSPTVLEISASDSQVVILVGKAGLLSFAGHAHEVVAPAVHGRVTFDPMDWTRASVSLEFDAAALRVTGKGESASDVPAVQQAMLGGQVLDVTRFAKIAFQSRRVSVALRHERGRRLDRRRHDAAAPRPMIGPARRWTPQGTSRPGDPSH
jgi:polyisoprenoid-binding protein YceI